jgi:glutathione S-transferase
MQIRRFLFLFASPLHHRSLSAIGFDTSRTIASGSRHRRHRTMPKSSLAVGGSENSNQQDIQFVTNTWCPFAQKAWIALEASNAQYDMREVSLYGAGGKPDWFWELNPRGTVPVVVVKDGGEKTVLADSEYILDAVMDGRIKGDGRMLLDESKERYKKISKWREIISEQLIPVGKSAVLGGSKSKLQSLLKELDSLVVGPYLTGETLTIADAAAFPFLWRLDKEYGLGKKDTPNLRAWLDQCLQNGAVRKTIPSQGWWWWW